MADHDGIEIDLMYVYTGTPRWQWYTDNRALHAFSQGGFDDLATPESAEENDSKYTVGYGKPPRSTRFQPGQSGNPNGRARKPSTFDEEIEKELSTTIVVVENGKQKRITKRRAIVKQQVNKAASGDLKSAELLLKNSKQNRSEQQDNVKDLVEEFRERNRRISGKDDK
jgi:hypothetical protein